MDTTTVEMNISNSSNCTVLYTDKNQHIFYYFGLALIFVVGISANTSVVLLITFVRELRNTSNIFILILCASNNVFLLIFMPVEVFHPDFISESLFMNMFIQFAMFLFCSVSILSLVMMSFDRWRAVVRPMDRKSQSVKTTAAKVITVLILATILALPTGFSYVVEEEEECNITYIQMDETKLRIVTYYCMVTLYICPLSLISFLYLSMAKKLLIQGKTIRESLRHHVKPRAQRSRVAWVVMGLVVSFAVCWFPFYLFLILFVTDPLLYERLFNFLFNWRPLFTLFNTCIDPLSIFLLGSRFRNHLWNILCCGFNFRKDRYTKRESAVTATVRRTRSSSSSNSTTRTALHLPPVSPHEYQCLHMTESKGKTS